MLSEEDMSRLMICLRQEQLDKLDWDEGQDLEMDIRGSNLILKPKDRE